MVAERPPHKSRIFLRNVTRKKNLVLASRNSYSTVVGDRTLSALPTVKDYTDVSRAANAESNPVFRPVPADWGRLTTVVGGSVATDLRIYSSRLRLGDLGSDLTLARRAVPLAE